MRKKRFFYNSLTAIILSVVTAAIGFFAQKVFIGSLGIEYLGLNNLFLSIVGVLTLADMGVGGAIIYHLYSAIAQDNKNKIRSLLEFYRKVCWIVAGIILILGIIIMFFLPYIAKVDNISTIEAKVLFSFFVIYAACSYLLIYKKSLLLADQKNYIVNIIQVFYVVIIKLIQMTVLFFAHNFYAYLIVSIIGKILQNLITSIIVDRQYPYLKTDRKHKLPKVIKKDIYKKVHGLVYHNVASYIVLGTDNVLIARLFSVVEVGLYANYYLIMNGVNMLFSQVFSSLSAGFGNLLVTEGKEYARDLTKNLFFLSAWVYMWAGACLLLLTEPFLQIWLGDGFSMGLLVLVCLVINFYIQGLRAVPNAMLNAAGIMHENRFVPVAEMVVNLIASIVCAHFFGIAGIFMGTVISSLILHFYSYPKYVFKKVLGGEYADYIRLFIKYVIVAGIIWCVSYYFGSLISFDSSFAMLAVRFIFCVVIPNVCFLAIYFRTSEFKYFTSLLRDMMRKIRVRFNQ